MKLNKKDLSDKELLSEMPSIDFLKSYRFEKETEEERVGINLMYAIKKWITLTDNIPSRYYNFTKLVKWAIRTYINYLKSVWKVEEMKKEIEELKKIKKDGE
jgi:hypothetical protein